MRIAYQGIPGAFSQLAARTRHPDAATRGMATFDDVVRAVRDGHVDAGVLPLENTVIGAVESAVRALEAGGGVTVEDEILFPVVHCILALPGATLDTIRWAESHPAALGQCTGWLAAHEIPGRAVVDTAGAARSIATDRDYTRAAIASAAAGELYGLTILARDIADLPGNTTRFVIIRACRAEVAA